ncbi:MAG: hypothetical protein FJ267_09935 [Planctomycetes bacterium]|nr:hypothetical protein [Planctomycetota bacterium]
MNSKTNQPGNDDGMSPFELKLRSQSLGPNASQRGEVMYACGYAAGMEAANRKAQGVTNRWRVVSLVASIFLCISISSHFLPTNNNIANRIGFEPQVKRGASEPMVTNPESSSDAWITLLTRDRRADKQTIGTLRATGSALPIEHGDGLDSRLNPIPSSLPNTPLRPIDFPLFL